MWKFPTSYKNAKMDANPAPISMQFSTTSILLCLDKTNASNIQRAGYSRWHGVVTHHLKNLVATAIHWIRAPKNVSKSRAVNIMQMDPNLNRTLPHYIRDKSLQLRRCVEVRSIVAQKRGGGTVSSVHSIRSGGLVQLVHRIPRFMPLSRQLHYISSCFSGK